VNGGRAAIDVAALDEEHQDEVDAVAMRPSGVG